MPGRMPGFHLSPEGKERAKKVGEFLKDRPIKYIYTSPLERTFETANILSDFFPHAKLVHNYELIEIDASRWQAFKYEDLYKNNYYEAFLNDPNTDQVPENLNKLAERMVNFIEKICQKHRGEEVICVTHDDPIIALKLALEHKPLTLLKNYQFPMGSINKLVLDENCNLIETAYFESPEVVEKK